MKLGDKYVDAVTGFEGIATAITTYLDGTSSIRLEAHTGNAEPRERWVTADRLEPKVAPTIGFHGWQK